MIDLWGLKLPFINDRNQKNTISDNNKHSLLTLTVKGLKITTFLTLFKTIIDFAAQIILARILAPEVFGIVALAIVFSGLFSLFSDMNALRWIIKKDTVSKKDFISVFTFEFFMAVIVSILWFLLSSTIFKAINKPEIIPYTKIFTLWIVLERLQQPKALFERNLNFSYSNIAAFFGILCGSVSMIIFAFMGFGGFSIIYGMIIRSGINCLVLWFLSPYKPSFYFDKNLLPKFFKFGFPISLSSVLVYYYGNIDYVIVGKILGETSLGYYFIAYKFPHYIHNLQMIVSSVAFPAFSRTRDDEQLKRGFALATKYSALFSMPILMYTILFGKELIRYLLGEKWLPALIPFQLFMFLAVVRIITVYWYEVYVSKGLTKIIPVFGFINCIGITVFVFFGAKMQGIIGAAIGVTITVLFTIILATQVYLKKILDIKYLKILHTPLIINLLYFIIILFFKMLFIFMPSVYLFWIILFVLALIYFILVYLFDKEHLFYLMNHLKEN